MAADKADKIAVIDEGGLAFDILEGADPGRFDLIRFISKTEMLCALDGADDPFSVICVCGEAGKLFELGEELSKADSIQEIPVLIVVSQDHELDFLKAMESGYDDVIDLSMAFDEICLRLNKAIFHRVAQSQLKNTADQAREMAFSAMSDSSDLGNNIQFLLNCNYCDNLDELGQMLFQSLQNYQVHCSVQMRSIYGDKNMEETGLTKDLESRLLGELKDKGRYVDFGERCVINYGSVSLLIKNMPIDDDKKYGAIKDNLITLVQGTDSRVKALEAQKSLEIERDFMSKLTNRLQEVMENLDESFQMVMKQSTELMDDLNIRFEETIMFLDLTEEQENTLEVILKKGIEGINNLYTDGARIDENFHKLINHLTTQFKSGKGGPSVTTLQELSSKL